MSASSIPIVVSLATYKPRLSALEQTLPYILNQTLPFDILIINVQDDLTDDEFLKFLELKNLDHRISVRKAPAKWRSFNKFVYAYQTFPNSPIITIDDDIKYPSHMLAALYDFHKSHPDTIVAHELNPVALDRSNHAIRNIMAADLKLRQKCFSKYLTGCALFPPSIFKGTEDTLFDYDLFNEITQGTHDELWMWIHSTCKGVPVVGLDYTWTFDADGALPPIPSSLRYINGLASNVQSYDDRINKSAFGPLIYQVMDRTPVVFRVNHSNLMAITGHMEAICRLYGSSFKILFDCSGPDFLPSMTAVLVNSINRCGSGWVRNVSIKTDREGVFGNGKED